MTIINSIFLFPLLGSFVLFALSNYLSRYFTQIIGVSSIFFSMVISLYISFLFLNQHLQSHFEWLWSWINIEDLKINFGFLLDRLSLTMLVMVTSVGFLIHLFSSWYMKFRDSNNRFFMYMNFFIFNMIILILADNFVLMYLGWEGVSVCSYLLVGFYYKQINTGYAAIKGFIITRIGDVFLLLAILIIYKTFGTLNFSELRLILESMSNVNNAEVLKWIAIFILLGAIGKSAQFPFHTWLVDAMVGPTPVSALIHAATMVTAGVYLIARMYFLFILSPEVIYSIGIIGSFTIVISCCCALVQTNIKRILAYSTMSQVGYMFLALGIHNWILAIKHLVIHAVFKTLLFLSTGSIITLLDNEQNIYQMGNLRKQIPFLCLSFFIGSASLSALPIITSGFYSKGDILFSTFFDGYLFFFICGCLGSFLTVIYTFRMFFLIFYRKSKIKLRLCNPKSMLHTIPLLILIVLSTVLGIFINSFIPSVTPKSEIYIQSKWFFEIFYSFISIIIIILTYYCWIVNIAILNYLLSINLIKRIHLFFLDGCGFNYLYNILFIKSFLYFSTILNNSNNSNLWNHILKNLFYFTYRVLSIMHNGYLRAYVLSVAIGSCLLIIALMLFI